jgi:hypothetical protein
VKCVGTISYVYSTSPCAGSFTGFGIFTTRSGCEIFHPFVHVRGAGASCASPAGAPASAQAEIAAICFSVKEMSSAKCPYRGSANHGGIIFISTACAIAFAHGRACS